MNDDQRALTIALSMGFAGVVCFGIGMWMSTKVHAADLEDQYSESNVVAMSQLLCERPANAHKRDYCYWEFGVVLAFVDDPNPVVRVKICEYYDYVLDKYRRT